MKQTIKTKILVTGSNGRFATVMKKFIKKKNYIFLDKKEIQIYLVKKVLEKFNKNINQKWLFIWLLFLDLCKFIMIILQKVLDKI